MVSPPDVDAARGVVQIPARRMFCGTPPEEMEEGEEDASNAAMPAGFGILHNTRGRGDRGGGLVVAC